MSAERVDKLCSQDALASGHRGRLCVLAPGPAAAGWLFPWPPRGPPTWRLRACFLFLSPLPGRLFRAPGAATAAKGALSPTEGTVLGCPEGKQSSCHPGPQPGSPVELEACTYTHISSVAPRSADTPGVQPRVCRNRLPMFLRQSQELRGAAAASPGTARPTVPGRGGQAGASGPEPLRQRGTSREGAFDVGGKSKSEKRKPTFKHLQCENLMFYSI